MCVCVCVYAVKVLELLCRREARAVFEAEGLQCLLTFVNSNASTVHRYVCVNVSLSRYVCGYVNVLIIS